jgi:hypothetical protein
MKPGKADAQALLDNLLPLAKRMLREYREFYPYGGRMSYDGKITHEGASDGTNHPPSQSLIDLLTKAHRQEAESRSSKAVAIIYDVRVVPAGSTEKRDAIATALDHVDGYSVIVYFPYRFGGDGELLIDAPFASEGAYGIFDRT